MTVEELIEELKKMPKDRIVVLPASRGDFYTELEYIEKCKVHIGGCTEDPKEKVVILSGKW